MPSVFSIFFCGFKIVLWITYIGIEGFSTLFKYGIHVAFKQPSKGFIKMCTSEEISILHSTVEAT